MPSEKFITKFHKLSDLDYNVKIKINSLLGKKSINELEMKSASNYSPISYTSDIEAYVTCQIYSNGKLMGLEQSTTYKYFPTEHIKWGQTIVFPIKYSDLSRTSTLVFTVWEVCHVSQLQSPLSMDIKKTLPPLPYAVGSQLSTLYKYRSSLEARPLGGSTIPVFNSKGTLKSGRHTLYLWPDKHGDGKIDTSTPYNRNQEVAHDRIEKIQITFKNLNHNKQQRYNKSSRGKNLFDKLAVRRYQQIRQEKSSNEKQLLHNSVGEQDMYLMVELFPGLKYPVVCRQENSKQRFHMQRFCILYDPAQGSSNPIEDKHEKLAPAAGARHLKPGTQHRAKLDAIIARPNPEMDQEEKKLLWKYRFTLVNNKRALTKFLRSVKWTNKTDEKQAISLLKEWAKIEAVDALELLSNHFTNREVRAYAVDRLKEVPDTDLTLYLLQLVQALRYEPPELKEGESKLATFLLDRASRSFEISTFLHWFFVVEEKMPQNNEKRIMYKKLKDALLDKLKVGDANHESKRSWYKNIDKGSTLVKNLIDLVNLSKAKGGNTESKKERMRGLLRKGGAMHHLRRFETPISCPVRPEIQCIGINPDKSSMFKSALCPLMVAFETVDGGIYRAIFKNGDDLRQDQLIMQLIILIDRIWKDFKLDLKLKPYQILATGAQSGFLELIPNSTNIAEILRNHKNDIGVYFSSLNIKQRDLAKVLDTFVRSCAGYCVITFLLGIGDRHLDNVLLTAKGHMFHIDFGWAFGRDPKPLPPAMKFTKEMIMAMGGPESIPYKKFLEHVVTAFRIIRKHAGLILNLLSLMRDAHIEHLSLDGVDQNIEKVRKKFVLEKTDEQAAHYIINLVNESASAMFPNLVDFFHNVVTKYR